MKEIGKPSLVFHLRDEDDQIVDTLRPGKEYSEDRIWDELRIRAKGSAGVTLTIEQGDFCVDIPKNWTLALKSLGQSPDAVRLIRRIVEYHEPFDHAEARILKDIL